MGFKEKDTTAERTVSRQVKEVVFRRRDAEEGPPIEVLVEIIEDGASVVKRIDPGTAGSGWPGAKKSLKGHLLAIADIALAMD